MRKDNYSIRAKTELIRRGETISGLASKIGKSRRAVSGVINETNNYPKVKQLVSEELGLEAGNA